MVDNGSYLGAAEAWCRRASGSGITQHLQAKIRAIYDEACADKR
jgi:hypothetical protein